MSDILADIRPIEGWLTDNEALTLYELAKAKDYGVIVEIGSYQGKSTVALGKGALEVGAHVYAIDPFDVNTPAIATNSYHLLKLQENLTNAGLNDTVTVIHDWSFEVARTWDKPIDLLWIDGSHEYDDVMRDLVDWSEYSRVIALHDTSGNWPEVTNAMVDFFLARRDKWTMIKRMDSITVWGRK